MARRLTAYEIAKSVAAGLVTSLLVSVVMVNAYLAGLVPLPEPLSVAFAQKLFGGPFDFSYGMLLQFGWITTWTLAYLLLVRRHTFLKALLFALGLWLAVLFVFFPLVGWGVFGLALGPGLAPVAAALVPHALFAVLVWFFARRAVPDGPAALAHGR